MNDYELKKQDRIDRLRARSVAASNRSDAAYNQAKSMASAIPFGQPILVGHHSEKGDRAYRKRIDQTQARSYNESQKAQHYAGKADAAENNNAISSDDPEAVVKLREKIEQLESNQAGMKAVNVAYRKFKKNPASLDKSKLPDGDKARIRSFEPEYSWQKGPFESYQLSNNNANIRRCKQRLAQLEAESNREEAEDIVGEGYKIVEDVDENRILFHFDRKPPKDTCKAMRSAGFRWAPSRGAWSRQLNANGRYAAKAMGERIDRGEVKI
jgi:hypothetical protein